VRIPRRQKASVDQIGERPGAMTISAETDLARTWLAANPAPDAQALAEPVPETYSQSNREVTAAFIEAVPSPEDMRIHAQRNGKGGVS
jgi:hypothetical protein